MEQDEIDALAKSKLTVQWTVQAELRAVRGILGEHEQILNLAAGEYDGHAGLLVVTDRRVVFFEKGLIRTRQEDFPYDRISSVQTESKMLRGSLTIYVSNNKAVIKKVDPKQRVTEIGDYVRARISGAAAAPRGAQAPPAPTASTPAAEGPHERLRKLKALHDEGLLSEEEFQAKRAGILAEL